MKALGPSLSGCAAKESANSFSSLLVSSACFCSNRNMFFTMHKCRALQAHDGVTACPKYLAFKVHKWVAVNPGGGSVAHHNGSKTHR